MYPVRFKGRFYHSYGERQQRVFLPSIAMYIRSFMKRLRGDNDVRKLSTYSSEVLRGVSLRAYQHTRDMHITWIGHATFLIQLGGINILTDPVWGDATILFKRIMPPPIELTALPPIDYVLISHNHRDHMDISTLRMIKALNPHVCICVPVGDGHHVRAVAGDNVHEFFWWDTFVVEGIKITFLPAHHWSGRGVCDRNVSLWGSWMIAHPEKTIYFAGDTAYWKHFSCIRYFFDRIDIALMPVGPCEPYRHMRHSHLNADLAVRAFCDLGAQEFIPMHWGTFYFGEDYFLTPIKRLKNAWRQYIYRVKEKRLHMMKFGGSFSVDRLS
jgi:L-ascorbate metabolism protein UlaG (beta-lactamase superfamily)